MGREKRQRVEGRRRSVERREQIEKGREQRVVALRGAILSP
jgi:hypothetical protein